MRRPSQDGMVQSQSPAAGRIGGTDSAVARTIVWWAELLGAVSVLGFGILLLVASL